MLLHRKEPTFIQTLHSSLESEVLDFTHANKDQEYRILSCQQFRHSLRQFYHDFLEKTPMTPKYFQWGRRRNSSRTYICYLFLSSLHTVSAGLLYFFFLCVLNGSWLPCKCHVTDRHMIITSPLKWPHTIGKICVKMPSKSRQNRGSNGFSCSIPSNRPDLQLLPQPKG